MADKIKSSYKFSRSFYDDAITQGKWWSKLYFKLLWGGVDDNEIARRVLSWIPDDFQGRLLDVPVGTAVFPNKDKAYSEILRTLKPGGELLACFYIAGEQKVADWLAKTVMTRMGWFTPPFDAANDVRRRLEPYYDILDFRVEGAMLYFRAKKR